VSLSPLLMSSSTAQPGVMMVPLLSEGLLGSKDVSFSEPMAAAVARIAHPQGCVVCKLH
jgi:hypothetical protein